MKVRTTIFTLLSFLVALFPSHVGAITLGELEETVGTIEVGDKLFSDFTTNRPGISVEGLIFPLGNPGLRFRGAVDFGSDIMTTTNIGFTVTVLDPTLRITELFQAFVQVPTGDGTLRITDTAYALVTDTVLGSGTLFTTGLPTGPTPILNMYNLTIAVSEFRFERIVELTGPLSGPIVQAMSTTQAPIPEPSTIFLFGTGLAGLGFWRYRKARA